MTHRGPFQPQPFCDSVIYSDFSRETKCCLVQFYHYCQAQLLASRRRTERGSLPRDADSKGTLSSQPATKNHAHQIPTFGVTLTAYTVHSNECVLVYFFKTWITAACHVLHG